MRVYDTYSGQKQEFAPSDGPVRMYVCGVTPYAPCHVGHALSYVVFDVVRRYLEYRGHAVRHVQNFTDIDDKLIERARQEGTTVSDLAERHIRDYFRNMDALNIKRAHLYPRATQEVPRMLEIVQKLVDSGYAYAASGDVYFRVRSVPGYGGLSKRSLDGMMAGARVEASAQKEYPLDFALWKAAKPGEPYWESPWGPGRPGWHIECSAISLGYLGQPLDIHGGGQDLIFPHHENEMAQSEAYAGRSPFVRFWMHNGLLRLGEEKMSKSLGNLVTLREVLERYTPDALRLFFLSSHYRSPLAYAEEGPAAAERAMETLRVAANTPSARAASGEQVDAAPYRERFLQAMDDDFNTPQAVAALFDLAHEINRARSAGSDVAGAQATLRELGGEILGLTFQERAGEVSADARPFIELLVETRSQLRAARQFALADQIRGRLGELGVTLTDSPQGTEWKARGHIPDP
ncbi:MAG: cysteine--tRNA ligase [Chloroflexi bacterium]|nr:cysteine--tRNA ligase [Chloroflexota bacterium]